MDLADDTRAIRFTDLTGRYSFHVKPDDYNLRVSAACTITPNQIRKEDVRANIVQDFVAGSGCVTATPSNVIATGSVLTVRQGGVVLGSTYVRIEQRSSAGSALARLSEIAAEQPAPAISLTIAGNPAIERRMLINLPGPTEDVAGESRPRDPFLAITTAIAAGSTVVRFETQLPGNADAATIARFVQVARNFTPAALPGLHGPQPPPIAMTRNTPTGPAPSVPGILASGLVAPGAFGELEVASSDTANAIVY